MTPSFLAITYAFFLSYMPQHFVSNASKQPVEYTNATKVGYELGIEMFDFLRVYTGEETKQFPKNVTNWYPYYQAYYVGVECRKEFTEQFCVQIGARHLCEHPSVAWGRTYGDYESSCTEIYLCLEGRVPVFRR